MDNSALPSNVISVLDTDHSGNLWVGFENKGLAKFDGTKWTFLSISNSQLPSNDIYDIKTQADTVWVATYKGLAKIVGDSIAIKTFYSKYYNFTFTSVQRIVIDGQNRVWVGVKGNVFYKSGNIWYDTNSDGSCPLYVNGDI